MILFLFVLENKDTDEDKRLVLFMIWCSDHNNHRALWHLCSRSPIMIVCVCCGWWWGGELVGVIDFSSKTIVIMETGACGQSAEGES